MRLYTVPYTDMRHGWHVVRIASDLPMHAVCCVVCVGWCVCDWRCGGVHMSAFEHVAVGALQGLIWCRILI